MGRLNILPEPAFLALKPTLLDRLARVGASIHAAEFDALLDPLMRQTLQQGFADAHADEGTVWLLDESEENLTPAYNSGPRAGEWVGRFKLPLNAGLISMVLANEQPFLENEVWKNAKQSKDLDALLQVHTWAMIAVPFGFLRTCRGVISCVQLKSPATAIPDPPGFQPQDLAGMQRTAALLAQLIEYRFLSSVVGWRWE